MPEGIIEHPLSPSLPRDCGHECRVCKVTVVSLTDYASHISSPVHKQNVEAAEQRHAGYDNEDYFDRALVDLIEKRKEQIRKEKEAAAAKLKKEEEERKRKEEFQQRLKETKDRLRLECGWYNARPGEPQPWHNNQQGKSATWHAQEPRNCHRWASEEFTRNSFCKGWDNRQWDQGGFSANQQCRLPWLSSGGSNYGVYGQNNISQFSQRGRSMNYMGQNPSNPPPNSYFNGPFNQFQQPGNGQRGQQGHRKQNGEGQTAESDHKSNKVSKTFGSNPKLDKTCRWSPYPVTKSFESVLHKDTNPISPETPNVPKAKKQDKTPESSPLNKPSLPEQKPVSLPSSGQTVQEKWRHKAIPQELKPTGGSSSSSSSCSSSSSSSSSSSNAQKESYQTSESASSIHKAKKVLLSKEKKLSSLSGLNTTAPPTKVSSSGPCQSKPTPKQSGLGSNASSVGPLKTWQQQQLPEVCRAWPTALEKRASLEGSSNKKEMSLNIVEKQQKDCPQSQIGVNKENSCRQNATEPLLSVRPEKPLLHFSDSGQFLQSLRVSTSTMDTTEAAASNGNEEENSERVNKKQSSLDTDEAMQANEAGHSSESDNSRGGGEAQSVSGSGTKMDLPTVLKRDLTKHMGSKGKTGGHEPNLNIARRVRNVSESRRSDSEKDSGLKPTVRQLISSSGSGRNVNWEQVYQEVRKKQDKGKGMPRFGIEMVPNEQEDQSQEEDDIALLEGLHWDSLIGISAPGATRKRSLSESSLAPESTPSLFTSLLSKEKVQRESLDSERQESPVSPILTRRIKDVRCKQESDYVLDQCEANTPKQPEKPTSATVKAIRRSDSVPGDSSSGTEQLDGQGTGKRRRAAGDVPSAETSSLEHNNKRRKVKSKKDRLQIDQLLAVSLREEELSRSLQTVDTSLIQARAALEAAYLEVQRLMVVKRQVTEEMSSLRNERIELLKGMQGSLEDTPQVKLKEERMDATDADLCTASSIMLSSAVDTAPPPPPPPPLAAAAPNPNPPAQPVPPPPSSPPFMSVVIKEEPQSPVHVSSELGPVDNITHCAHSTTYAASPPDLDLSFQPSPERNPELYQSSTELIREKLGETFKESLSGPVEVSEKDTQTTTSCLTHLADSKTPKLLSSSRRGSELGNAAEATAATFTVPSVLAVPPSPPDLGSGKRVRKLKKRKVLKKAQGAEQPESSDTELDGELSRPRWPRPRRRSSGCSQVSTSILPAEDREVDMKVENGEEEAAAHRQLSPTVKLKRAHRGSSKHTVTLPSSAPTELTENVDFEESMEVTAASQLLRSDAQVLPGFSRPKLQSLACNEVTSTSDMDICRSSESDMPFAITLPKNSSEASSEYGGEEMATAGAFEGHQKAVNAMQIHNGLLYTCSGDRTVKAFDLVNGKCVAMFEGHSSKVSCLVVSAAPGLIPRLYTGSSDQTIRCYNLKTQEFEHQFALSDRILESCLHTRWRTLYAGLANGTVVTFNLKTNKQMDVFECHGPRAVSCLASSQEGARRILLVGSYDNSISVRDARNGLLLRTLEGHTKSVLCMKVVNDLVFSGSSDHSIYTHNIHTGELVQTFKGHSHAVTVVCVLGQVMVTACLDKLVRVYDLQSHELLQVYGGHKDMVMCMALHKSMIYTGCYDGSVQAVKLNLMQNHRCWWHGCSLIFGVPEHLQQHLISEHANVKTLKCRWKNCEEFFCVRNSSSQQVMLLHMCKHAEETDLEP